MRSVHYTLARQCRKYGAVMLTASESPAGG